MNRQKRAELRRSQRKLMTFAQAAQHCHAKVSAEAKNAKHAQQWINTLKQHAFPHIGSLPVDDITTQHVLDLLEPIWTLKPETASRVRQRIESTLTWATVSGYREGDNPARLKGNLDQLLPRTSKIKKVTHHKALSWKQLSSFLATLRKRDGMGARALELVILTACRSGEVRGATWSEIDVEFDFQTYRFTAGTPLISYRWCQDQGHRHKLLRAQTPWPFSSLQIVLQF